MGNLKRTISVLFLVPALFAACAEEAVDTSGSGGATAGASGSGQAGSGTAGSGTAGSGTAGSGTAGSGTAGSGDAGSGTAGSGTAGSGTAGSGTAGSDAGGAGGSGQAGAGGDQEPAEQAGITAEHNKVRAGVEPPAVPALKPLEWSSDLAAVAQAWADGCNFEHSSSPYGENLYASAGSEPSPAEVVQSWASEVASYDYASDGCSGVCGHYTQVVWAASTKVGCGMAKCTTNSPFNGFPEWYIWVCNYDPPGNFNNQRPYCSATVTSGCAQ